LRKRFGAVFAEYAARVPLFFPRAPLKPANAASASDSKENFSCSQYIGNREYNALIGTVAGFGIVWLRMWIRTRFGY
jgi:hypothetical protein